MRNGALCGTFLGVAVALSSTAALADTYYVYTGQSNAQTQIDVNHTSSWSFLTGNVPFELGGGNFTLKEGPQTVANLKLSLYLGTSAVGSPVAEIDLTNAQFDALYAPPITVPGSNTQSFTLVPIYFAAPYTLLANSQYFMALTSTALDQQSRAYFIKGYDTFTIQTPGGNPPPVSTPEPGTLGVFGLAMAGLAAWRRRSLARA